MKIEIIYEDQDIIIINKPAGVLVIPDRFNQDLPALSKLLPGSIFVVHRLDRETSGVLCFAKNETMHKYLSQQFRDHLVDKHYLGLVSGVVIKPEGSIKESIAHHPSVAGKMSINRKGKASHTDYTLLKQWSLYALLSYKLHTGRTHQIRVHSAHIGHPIVADNLYGNGQPFFLSGIKKKYRPSQHDEAERPLLGRLALHAHQLGIHFPDGRYTMFEAPIPKDMAASIKQLDKWG